VLFVVDQRTSSVIELASIKKGGAHTQRRPDAATGPLSRPWSATHGPGRTLVVADGGNNRVVVFDLAAGTSRPLAPAAAAGVGPLNDPRGVSVGPDGRLAIADTGNHRIVWSGFTLDEVAAGTADLDAWTAFGQPTVSGSTNPGDFEAPTMVHVDDTGRTWVTDPGLGALVRVDAADGSGWTPIVLPPGSAPLQPYGVAGHPLGVLVTDLVNARVLLVDPADDTATPIVDGSTDRRVIAPLIAVGHRKNLVVADSAGARLVRWSPDGAGGWTYSGELIGIPDPTGGPHFARITGLGSTGATS
jgi:streptogramin lyase